MTATGTCPTCGRALPCLLHLRGAEGQDLRLDPTPKPGVLVIPTEVWESLSHEARVELTDSAATIHVPHTIPDEAPRVRRSDVALRLLALLVVTLVVCLACYRAGEAAGLRNHAEERRTRTAVCQVLDQLGADASTEAQAWPCRDTPAPGPGGHR